MKSQLIRNVLGLSSVIAALAASPVVYAAFDAAYETNRAYEELSGTHAASPSPAASAPNKASGFAERAFWLNAAYEELSGTHASGKNNQMGFAGRVGEASARGDAGSTTSTASQLFRIEGDVADGCSKYLRCTNN